MVADITEETLMVVNMSVKTSVIERDIDIARSSNPRQEEKRKFQRLMHVNMDVGLEVYCILRQHWIMSIHQ